jgi:hypothetical protein
MVVFSPALSAEWKKHWSRYARKWLMDMYGRKRVVRLDAAADSHPATAAAAAVFLDSNGAAAVVKDIHLVGSALLSDRRIISQDKAVAELLSVLAPHVRPIGTIVWVDPSDAACFAWLAAGAPDSSTMLLRAR